MLVQFGNNWIQKIPRTAKLDSAVLGIFLIQLFPNWTACSPITYTNYALVTCGHIMLLFCQGRRRNVSKFITHVQGIVLLIKSYCFMTYLLKLPIRYTSTPGIELAPHWWEATALTAVPQIPIRS